MLAAYLVGAAGEFDPVVLVVDERRRLLDDEVGLAGMLIMAGRPHESRPPPHDMRVPGRLALGEDEPASQLDPYLARHPLAKLSRVSTSDNVSAKPRLHRCTRRL